MTGHFPIIRPDRNTCVLVCDPDPAARRLVRAALARRDALHVVEADTLQAAVMVIPRCAAVLLSTGPDADEAVLRLRASGFEGALVVALEDGSVGAAVAAMRAGADDVVLKPLKPEEVVDRLLAETPARRPDRRRGAPPPPQNRGGDFCGFIGRSGPMAALYDGIARVAASHAPVFITGEFGTGKDLAAAAVHACSTRRDGPFEALSCRGSSGIQLERDLFGDPRDGTSGVGFERPGAIRRAAGGTLRLDEICDMEPDLQAKLLDVLDGGRSRPADTAADSAGEVREVEARIICTTSRDPLEEVRAGRLREDLYYRLHVLHLHLPPLRTRGDDVLLLAETFLARFAGEEGRPLPRLGPEATAALRSRAFRGNVRELQNLMRRVAILMDGPVVSEHLVAEPGIDAQADPAPSEPRASWSGAPSAWGAPARVEPLSVVERRAIEAAIAAFDGNISLAAAALDLSPSTLYRKKLAWQDGRRLS